MRVAAAIALTLAVALLAGGCGGSRRATTMRTSSRPGQCRLSAAQRREIGRADREIARMHSLEAPLKTWREQGPPALEAVLNRFLLGVGTLPVNEREVLIRLAKSATGLCGDCFDALEAIEPAEQTRLGESPCKPGF